MRMSVMRDGLRDGSEGRRSASPPVENYWLVITTLPLLDVVRRTVRAPVADGCETVPAGMRSGIEMFAVALRVVVVLVAGVVTRLDVVAVVVPTLRTGGFDAAVGDGVRLD